MSGVVEKEFKTFTVGYDVLQDRIYLNILFKDGRVEKLHFTRRLLNSLIIQLVHQIELHTSTPRVEKLVQEVEQNMLQQKSRNSRKNEGITPVKAASADPRIESLCASASLSATDNGIGLKFLDRENGVCAKAFLTWDLMRQTLDILKNTYDKADWSTESFPAWCGQEKSINHNRTFIN